MFNEVAGISPVQQCSEILVPHTTNSSVVGIGVAMFSRGARCRAAIPALIAGLSGTPLVAGLSRAALIAGLSWIANLSGGTGLSGRACLTWSSRLSRRPRRSRRHGYRSRRHRTSQQRHYQHERTYG